MNRTTLVNLNPKFHGLTNIPARQKNYDFFKYVFCVAYFHQQTVVNFINCFAPYAYLLRIAPNFCASKKLLKSWGQSAKLILYLFCTDVSLLCYKTNLLNEFIIRKKGKMYMLHVKMLAIIDHAPSHPTSTVHRSMHHHPCTVRLTCDKNAPIDPTQPVPNRTT